MSGAIINRLHHRGSRNELMEAIAEEALERALEGIEEQEGARISEDDWEATCIDLLPRLTATLSQYKWPETHGS